ncbi:MAG: CNNM domain-containing protein [Puniceicoccaceae bacterium]
MIFWLILAVAFTILVSALCSILEALVLSTKPTEVEDLKRRHPWRGEKLGIYTRDIEETSSAILGLNTIANTTGASVSGALAGVALGEGKVALFSISLTLAILLFSEVIPKNAGVLYRKNLQPILIFPLHAVRFLMRPLSFLCKSAVKMIFPRRPQAQEADQEIILLAELSARDGDLSDSEREMVSNALKLDEVLVHSIMTPRTVITALDAQMTVAEVMGEFRNIPFARLPVYREELNEIFGVVRRRDILAAAAEGSEKLTIEELAGEVIFIPDSASADDALQTFLKKHQQIAVVVDEFGSVAGVLTLEDIMETILGEEIFEHDDVAVDMREFARTKRETEIRNRAAIATPARTSPVREASRFDQKQMARPLPETNVGEGDPADSAFTQSGESVS